MNIVLGIFTLIVLIGIWDVLQKKHTIRRNYPVVGWGRYIIEAIGPELRQYLFASNREELPFNRVQRGYIYASAKNENNLEGFGSDANFNEKNYFFIKHSAFPYRPSKEYKLNADNLPCAKVMGAYNKRKHPFRPKSIVNISAMSYGALGQRATLANNLGASQAGAYHNTGEGGFSQYHKTSDVIFQGNHSCLF